MNRKQLKKNKLNKQKEYLRCLNDPVYFFNNYCKVYDYTTGKYVKPKITHRMYERFIEFKNLENSRQTRQITL